jgi:hypothetical protein
MLLQRLRPESPADRELEARILGYLLARNAPATGQIEVDANNGTVTVRGRVRTFYQRQLCVHCCLRVAGVVRLVDQIHVTDAADATANDPSEPRPSIPWKSPPSSWNGVKHDDYQSNGAAYSRGSVRHD